ncbi:MAG: O-antigen export system ATP-binding protein RfbE, partial [Pseudomonadota bacterium]
FEAKSGDRIGILGLNGSGKSSLMKVIAGIYPVHSGKLDIKGKVIAALETGTGFDYNLNAKDNIKLGFIFNNNYHNYYTEAVDKILDFAQLKDHATVPIGTYSSGMIARLAFATTFFQIKNCDILLLDEVLATGDVSFINKADNMLKKTWNNVDIAITVSHSINEIQKMCDKCYIMSKGKVVDYGTTDKMISEYNRLYENNESL